MDPFSVYIYANDRCVTRVATLKKKKCQVFYMPLSIKVITITYRKGVALLIN